LIRGDGDRCQMSVEKITRGCQTMSRKQQGTLSSIKEMIWYHHRFSISQFNNENHAKFVHS
jgi:hypothetical protein